VKLSLAPIFLGKTYIERYSKEGYRFWSGVAGGAYEGYRQDGVLGALAGGINAVNPFAHAGIALAVTVDAAEKGDYKQAGAYGYEATKAIVQIALVAIGAGIGARGGGAGGSSLNPTEAPVFRGGSSMTARPIDVKTTPSGMVKPIRGISLSTDAANLERFGGARQIRNVPEGLHIVQQGKPGHYELVPTREMSMEQYQSLLNKVEFY